MCKNKRLHKTVSLIVSMLFLINNISWAAPYITRAAHKKDTLKEMAAALDGRTSESIENMLMSGSIKVVPPGSIVSKADSEGDLTDDELRIAVLCGQWEVVDMIWKAESGHPKGSLNLLPLSMSAYFGGTFRYDANDPDWVNRDRLVVSGGHTAPGLYVPQAEAGFRDRKQAVPMKELLPALRQKGSPLQGHIDMTYTPADMSAGSLGKGPSAAAGMAHAGKMDDRDYFVEVEIGDSESTEGQISEAMDYIGLNRLDNVIIWENRNKKGLTGDLSRLTRADNLKRAEAFGFRTHLVRNGDDPAAVEAMRRQIRKEVEVARKELERLQYQLEHKCIGPVQEANLSPWVGAAKEKIKPTYVQYITTPGAGLPGMQAHGEAPKTDQRDAAVTEIKRQLKELTGVDFDEAKRDAVMREFKQRVMITAEQKNKIDNENEKRVVARRAELQAIADGVKYVSPVNPASNYATRSAGGDELVGIMKDDLGVVAIDLELEPSVKLSKAAKAFYFNHTIDKPTGRVIEAACREVNAANLAAGFATCGKIPVVHTFASFIPMMAEPLLTILNTSLPIILVGTHAGLATGPDGRTHQDPNSQRIIGALPGTELFESCDAEEARFIGRFIHKWAREVAQTGYTKGKAHIFYERRARLDTPIIGKPEGWEKEAERGFYVIYENDLVEKEQISPPGLQVDVVIVSVGTPTYDAIEAAKELAKEGISVRVINVTQHKSLIRNEENIRSFAVLIKDADNLITVCDALPETIGEYVNTVTIKTAIQHKSTRNLGIQLWGESATPAELYYEHGFDKTGIVQTALDAVKSSSAGDGPTTEDEWGVEKIMVEVKSLNDVVYRGNPAKGIAGAPEFGPDKERDVIIRSAALNSCIGDVEINVSLPVVGKTELEYKKDVSGEHIVGYMVYAEAAPEDLQPLIDDCLYIHYIPVHPDMRDKGIGEELFRKAVEIARQKGKDTIALSADVTSSVRTPFIDFYDRLGKLPEVARADIRYRQFENPKRGTVHTYVYEYHLKQPSEEIKLASAGKAEVTQADHSDKKLTGIERKRAGLSAGFFAWDRYSKGEQVIWELKVGEPLKKLNFAEGIEGIIIEELTPTQAEIRLRRLTSRLRIAGALAEEGFKHLSGAELFSKAITLEKRTEQTNPLMVLKSLPRGPDAWAKHFENPDAYEYFKRAWSKQVIEWICNVLIPWAKKGLVSIGGERVKWAKIETLQQIYQYKEAIFELPGDSSVIVGWNEAKPTELILKVLSPSKNFNIDKEGADLRAQRLFDAMYGDILGMELPGSAISGKSSSAGEVLEVGTLGEIRVSASTRLSELSYRAVTGHPSAKGADILYKAIVKLEKSVEHRRESNEKMIKRALKDILDKKEAFLLKIKGTENEYLLFAWMGKEGPGAFRRLVPILLQCESRLGILLTYEVSGLSYDQLAELLTVNPEERSVIEQQYLNQQIKLKKDTTNIGGIVNVYNENLVTGRSFNELTFVDEFLAPKIVIIDKNARPSQVKATTAKDFFDIEGKRLYSGENAALLGISQAGIKGMVPYERVIVAMSIYKTADSVTPRGRRVISVNERAFRTALNSLNLTKQQKDYWLGALGWLKSAPASVQAKSSSAGTTFSADLKFLKKHLGPDGVVVLSDAYGKAQLAVCPGYQGRVMTSTAEGSNGLSFGWINREQIEKMAKGQKDRQINVVGGADRLWIGPEGGQYSIFFEKDSSSKFPFEAWKTPAFIDTEPFEVFSGSVKRNSVTFWRNVYGLTNRLGTKFDLRIDRTVRVLERKEVGERVGVDSLPKSVNVVAYESNNRVTNIGEKPWRKETGLLSMWSLGQFIPSPDTTVVVPIRPGSEERLGRRITNGYFGKPSVDRLVTKKSKAHFFKADGQKRGKIGVPPEQARSIIGSYDAENNVLTLVQYNKPRGATEYVNSLWEIQERPFDGDAVNAYCDGPVKPGGKPLGPFYELETSSPALALKPGETSAPHIHRTIHLKGPEAVLNKIALKTLGVSLDEIKTAFDFAIASKQLCAQFEKEKELFKELTDAGMGSGTYKSIQKIWEQALNELDEMAAELILQKEFKQLPVIENIKDVNDGDIVISSILIETKGNKPYVLMGPLGSGWEACFEGCKFRCIGTVAELSEKQPKSSSAGYEYEEVAAGQIVHFSERLMPDLEKPAREHIIVENMIISLDIPKLIDDIRKSTERHILRTLFIKSELKTFPLLKDMIDKYGSGQIVSIRTESDSPASELMNLIVKIADQQKVDLPLMAAIFFDCVKAKEFIDRLCILEELQQKQHHEIAVKVAAYPILDPIWSNYTRELLSKFEEPKASDLKSSSAGITVEVNKVPAIFGYLDIEEGNSIRSIISGLTGKDGLRSSDPWKNAWAVINLSFFDKEIIYRNRKDIMPTLTSKGGLLNRNSWKRLWSAIGLSLLDKKTKSEYKEDIISILTGKDGIKSKDPWKRLWAATGLFLFDKETRTEYREEIESALPGEVGLKNSSPWKRMRAAVSLSLLDKKTASRYREDIIYNLAGKDGLRSKDPWKKVWATIGLLSIDKGERIFKVNINYTGLKRPHTILAKDANELAAKLQKEVFTGLGISCQALSDARIELSTRYAYGKTVTEAINIYPEEKLEKTLLKVLAPKVFTASPEFSTAVKFPPDVKSYKDILQDLIDLEARRKDKLVNTLRIMKKPVLLSRISRISKSTNKDGYEDGLRLVHSLPQGAKDNFNVVMEQNHGIGYWTAYLAGVRVRQTLEKIANQLRAEQIKAEKSQARFKYSDAGFIVDARIHHREFLQLQFSEGVVKQLLALFKEISGAKRRSPSVFIQAIEQYNYPNIVSAIHINPDETMRNWRWEYLILVDDYGVDKIIYATVKPGKKPPYVINYHNIRITALDKFVKFVLPFIEELSKENPEAAECWNETLKRIGPEDTAGLAKSSSAGKTVEIPVSGKTDNIRCFSEQVLNERLSASPGLERELQKVLELCERRFKPSKDELAVFLGPEKLDPSSLRVYAQVKRHPDDLPGKVTIAHTIRDKEGYLLFALFSEQEASAVEIPYSPQERRPAQACDGLIKERKMALIKTIDGKEVSPPRTVELTAGDKILVISIEPSDYRNRMSEGSATLRDMQEVRSILASLGGRDIYSIRSELKTLGLLALNCDSLEYFGKYEDERIFVIESIYFDEKFFFSDKSIERLSNESAEMMRLSNDGHMGVVREIKEVTKSSSAGVSDVVEVGMTNYAPPIPVITTPPAYAELTKMGLGDKLRILVGIFNKELKHVTALDDIKHWIPLKELKKDTIEQIYFIGYKIAMDSIPPSRVYGVRTKSGIELVVSPDSEIPQLAEVPEAIALCDAKAAIRATAKSSSAGTVEIDEFLKSQGVCALISPSVEDAEELIKIISDAECPYLGVEIAFRGDRERVIKLLKLASEYSRSKIVVAAGTVLDAQDAFEAIKNGARLIVTPGLTLTEGDIEKIHTLGAKVVMGVGSPQEAQRAKKRGADAIKAFPYNIKGDHIKALKGPLPSKYHDSADRYVRLIEGGKDILATFTNVYEWLKTNPNKSKRFGLPLTEKDLVKAIKGIMPSGIAVFITGGVLAEDIKQGLLDELEVGAALSVKSIEEAKELVEVIKGKVMKSSSAGLDNYAEFTPIFNIYDTDLSSEVKNQLWHLQTALGKLARVRGKSEFIRLAIKDKRFKGETEDITLDKVISVIGCFQFSSEDEDMCLLLLEHDDTNRIVAVDLSGGFPFYYFIAKITNPRMFNSTVYREINPLASPDSEMWVMWDRCIKELAGTAKSSSAGQVEFIMNTAAERLAGFFFTPMDKLNIEVVGELKAALEEQKNRLISLGKLSCPVENAVRAGLAITLEGYLRAIDEGERLTLANDGFNKILEEILQKKTDLKLHHYQPAETDVIGTIILNEDELRDEQRNEMVGLFSKISKYRAGAIERLGANVVLKNEYNRDEDWAPHMVAISKNPIPGAKEARLLDITIEHTPDALLPVDKGLLFAKGLLLYLVTDRAPQVEVELSELYRLLRKGQGEPLQETELLDKFIDEGVFTLLLPKPERVDKEHYPKLLKLRLLTLIAA